MRDATMQSRTASKWVAVAGFLFDLRLGKGERKGLRRVVRTVLLLDKHGNHIKTIGESLGPESPLSDPKLRQLRHRIKACLKGQSFFAKLRLKGKKMTSDIRGEPLLTPEGEVAAVYIAIEDPQPAERLMPTDETAFVIENMRQGFWRLNTFGIIIYANPHLAQWLETKPQDMVGRHFSEYRRLGIVEAGPLDQSLSQRFEAEFKTTTGIVRRAIVVTSPAVDSTGTLTGTVDLITDITSEHALQRKLVQEVQEMTKLASTDPLTGAANRSVFDSALLELAADVPCGVIVVDLDHFKAINDVHGHPVGDEVLIQVVERIRSCVRDDDVIVRLGGDEFAVLLPNTPLEASREVAARMAKELHFETKIEGHSILVSVSVGMSHSSLSTDLLAVADKDMYRAKSERRRRLAFRESRV